MQSAAPAQEPGGAARRLLILVIGVAAVVGAVRGWQLFFFLTDDAHIAFRYVANSLAGKGLVWNAAPFRPVEGYTSFLWVVILREVWRFTGIEPPESAGVLGLFFALGTLYLTFRFILSLSLPPSMERWRLGFLVLALAGILLNRTFLAWMSSGLETALFNFTLTWWVYEGTRRGMPTTARLVRLTTAATLCALSRPDGLLVVAATTVQLAVNWTRQAGPRVLLAATPLLAIPLHVLWRHHTYGEWLPNTFRAKVHKPWPESGVRYAVSFILEYAVWVWILLLLVWAVRSLLKTRRRADLPAELRPALVTALTIATLVAHWSYYTFIVGGDHFEFRAYSHLVPLLFVSAIWLAARVLSTPVLAAEALLAFVLFSLPIPWLHWFVTRDLATREETAAMYVDLARYYIFPFNKVVGQWDDAQAWLMAHSVGLRHQEHKVFWLSMLEVFPPREVGLQFGLHERTVLPIGYAGVPAWTLPNTNIIDLAGLNDAVVPRIGALYSENQHMAHDRFAPSVYVECFRPNTAVIDGRPQILPGIQPLTDDEVRSCETRDWSKTIVPGEFTAWNRSHPLAVAHTFKERGGGMGLYWLSF